MRIIIFPFLLITLISFLTGNILLLIEWINKKKEKRKKGTILMDDEIL